MVESARERGAQLRQSIRERRVGHALAGRRALVKLRHLGHGNIEYIEKMSARGVVRAGAIGIRAGWGIFYDRFAETNVLNALRYNGVAQQNYLIDNPITAGGTPCRAFCSWKDIPE